MIRSTDTRYVYKTDMNGHAVSFTVTEDEVRMICSHCKEGTVIDDHIRDKDIETIQKYLIGKHFITRCASAQPRWKKS